MLTLEKHFQGVFEADASDAKAMTVNFNGAFTNQTGMQRAHVRVRVRV